MLHIIAKPRPQQLADLLLRQRLRRGDARRAAQQGQYPVEPATRVSLGLGAWLRHLQCECRAGPVLPMLSERVRADRPSQRQGRKKRHCRHEQRQHAIKPHPRQTKLIE